MRKTVKCSESESKIIEKLLDGCIVEVEDGRLSKKILNNTLKHLKDRGLLYWGYNQKKRLTYMWLDESVDEDMIEKKKSSTFGDMWELIFR